MYQPGYQQQVTRAPFPYDRITANPVNVGNNGCNIFNLNLPTIGSMNSQTAVPIITGAAMNFFSARIQGNPPPVHIFVFNQMSSNGWNNRDFMDVVINIYYYVALSLSKNLFNDFYAALGNAVNNIGRMASMNAILMYGDLASACGQKMYDLAKGFVNDALVIQNDLRNFANMVGNNAVQNNNFNQQILQPQQQMNNQIPVGNIGNSLFSSFDNTHGQNTAAVAAPSPVSSEGRFSYLTKNMPSSQANNNMQAGYRQTPNQPVQQEPEKPSTIIDWIGEPTKYKWTPTEEQPYVPAINSIKKVRVLTFKESNSGKKDRPFYEDVDPYILNVTEQDMDRNRHYITPITKRLDVFKPPAVPMDVSLVSSELNGQRVVKEILARPEIIGTKVNKTEIEAMESCSSLEEAFNDCRFLHLVLKDKESTVRCETSIRKVFFASEKLLDTFKALTEAESFRQLSNLIRTKLLNKEADKETLEFTAALDRYLRNRLIHVLRYQLGISNLSFDSFIEDAESLGDFIKEKYGDKFRQALQNYERTFIQTYLNTPEVYSCDTKVVGTEEVSAVSSLVVEEFITVTYVDITADQLNVALSKNTPNLVSRVTLPQLFKFIEDTIGAYWQSTLNYAGHYFITNDDRRFQINIGFMGTKDIPSLLIHEVE